MKITALLISFFSIFIATNVSAADKWNIGFNHSAIAGHLQLSGKCAGVYCPTNSDLFSSTNSIARIYDLAANRHVGTFREIIQLGALAPTAPFPGNPTGNRNYQQVIDIVTAYSSYDANLVLTVGLPLPNWMLVDNGLPTYANVMPQSDAEWEVLKNQISMEVGYLVKALWDSPYISRAWMSTRLKIEGFNEFDSLEHRESLGGNNPPLRGRATPERAASLQNGIQWALNYFNLPVQTLMPSIVGVFPSISMATYVKRYYDAYGTGYPNIHIYIGNDTISSNNASTEFANKFAEIVSSVDAQLPERYKNQIYVTETGAAERDATYCPQSNGSSMVASERDQLYLKIASHPTTLAKVKSLHFWRLVKGPSSASLGCETFFGVETSSFPSTQILYNGAGINLFNYLQN